MSMAQNTSTHEQQDPFAYNNTTTLQRDIIIELASHYPEGVSGVRIRDELRDHYGEKVKKATFYTSIDRLEKQGLVAKDQGGISGRSHRICLTDECIDYLEEYVQWQDDLGIGEFGEVDEE